MQAAVSQQKPSPAKAAFMGVNLRVNLIEALHATWETAQVAIKTGVALHTPFDLAEWLGIGVEAVSAVRSIYSSLVQYMPPINYVTYVILGKQPAGLSEDQLKKLVEEFLNNPSSADFEWYLGMGRGLVDKAKQATKPPAPTNWFTTVIQKLADDEMIERRDGLVMFKSRNFTFGMKSDSE